ncbi:MAG: hypothetical protein LBS70_01265 [Candidatus Accumulibacter sp.]|nr:hypothetical protein [Accumulibacter sp.]
MKAAPFRTKFPLAEGVGVFIGILAWDILNDGWPNPLKALLIAVPCALVWFAIRCWRRGADGETENQPH